AATRCTCSRCRRSGSRKRGRTPFSEKRGTTPFFGSAEDAMTRAITIGLLALVVCGSRAIVADGAKTTKADVDRWMTELSNWGRWGKDDQIGTLNLITAEKRKQALRLVRDGVSVSLAHTLDKEQFPDNPRPIGQQMTLDA